MTSNIKPNTLYRAHSHADTLRILAGFCGLCGATLILLTAGASDAGLVSLPNLFLRIALAGMLLLLGFVLRHYAKELCRKKR